MPDLGVVETMISVARGKKTDFPLVRPTDDIPPPGQFFRLLFQSPVERSVRIRNRRVHSVTQSKVCVLFGGPTV